ncbi:MAG: hypothetical protein KKD11_06685, partial [Candidatus Omnitrophica bacterium]|nr:hypothetical protein [Candidatus Omnitrophota bacterium]
MNKELFLKKNARVIYVKGDTLYAQIGKHICISKNLGETWESISGNLPHQAVSSPGLYTRITRKGIHSALFSKDGNLVFIAKNKIYKFDPDKGKIINSFDVPRGSRPLSMCRAQDGTLLWGEYFRNSDRNEVNIYESKDNADTWQVNHTFERGSIRHIHGVFCDPYDDRVWVTTGDKDAESG